MYGLYGYDEMGEELIETFETEDALRQYASDYEMYSDDSESGYFGRTPDGEELSL